MLVHWLSRAHPSKCSRAILEVFGVKSLTGALKTRQAHSAPRRVLGIETSCDDTGSAVVDEFGCILGEALNSQTSIHVELVRQSHFYIRVFDFVF